MNSPKTWLELAQKLWPQHFADMTEVPISTGITKMVKVETQVKILGNTNHQEDKIGALHIHYLTLKDKFDSKLRVFGLTKFDSMLNSFITKVKK